MEAHPIKDGCEFRLAYRWLDEQEAPLLTEDRTVRFIEGEDAHFCEIISTRHASRGAVRFPKTKFGGLGFQADPLLAPDAELLSSPMEGVAARSKSFHEMDSDYVAYEADRPASQGGALGICSMIRDLLASVVPRSFVISAWPWAQSHMAW